MTVNIKSLDTDIYITEASIPSGVDASLYKLIPPMLINELPEVEIETTPDLFIHNDWNGTTTRYEGTSMSLYESAGTSFNEGIPFIHHEDYPVYSYAPVWIIPEPTALTTLVLALIFVCTRRSRYVQI